MMGALKSKRRGVGKKKTRKKKKRRGRTNKNEREKKNVVRSPKTGRTDSLALVPTSQALYTSSSAMGTSRWISSSTCILPSSFLAALWR